MEFYLEFLVLFIHLDPETNWSKIEDGNIDKKDKNKTYMHMNLGGLELLYYIYTHVSECTSLKKKYLSVPKYMRVHKLQS